MHVRHFLIALISLITINSIMPERHYGIKLMLYYSALVIVTTVC